MPGRTYIAGDKYRYGFNGKENDSETSSGTMDFGTRVYDSRIGRFFSVDPLRYSFPWYSPYQFAGNSPIVNIDLDGLENISIHKIPGKSITMQVVYTLKDIQEVLKPNGSGKLEKRITYTQEGSKEVKPAKQFEGPSKIAEQKLFDKLSNNVEGGIRKKDLLGESPGEAGAHETISEPAPEAPATKTDPTPGPKANPALTAPATKTIKYATFDIQVDRRFIEDFSKFGNDFIKTYIRDMGAYYKEKFGLDQVIFRKISLVNEIIGNFEIYNGATDGNKTGAKPQIIEQGTKEVPANTPTTDQLP
jgi:RHS repeat-associated protein